MKIQLESGPSSSATHSLTRPSTTLNRRYVSRPTTLAIEEAARSAQSSYDHEADLLARPSRLVNMHVHNSDLATMYPAEPQAPSTPPAPVNDTPSFTQTMPALPAQTYSTNEPDTCDYSEPTYPAYPTYPTEDNNSAYYPAPVSNPVNYYGYSEDYVVSEPETPAVPEATATPDIDTKALAMNIAADYTAATLGATMSNITEYADQAPDKLSAAINEQRATDSVDEIARTASEAIASIRSATDPADIATQIDSLQEFAENIKSNNNLPEIAELGATIDKFISIARKSTGIKEETAKKKATLSSKANRAADKVARSSAKISTSQAKARPLTARKPASTTSRSPQTSMRPTMARTVRPANSINQTTQRRTTKPKTTASYSHDDLALRRALSSVAKMDDEPAATKTARRPIKRKTNKVKHFFIAFGCAALCVAAIIYFVGANIPDISVRVAAMQTGVEASYPSYVPRGYSLKDISSEDSKIALTFSNPESDSFTLIEERSSWDSTALLRNYVEPTWQDSYSTTHEQGITIYIYGSNAAWVNGGVLYKINCQSNSLSKKQLRNIVTSMQ